MVVDSDGLTEVRDRDLIVIGSGSDQPVFRQWHAPLQVDSGGFRLAEVYNWIDRGRLWLHGGFGAGRQQVAELLNAANPPEYGAMEFESSESRGQTVLALASHDAGDAEPLVAMVIPANTSGSVSGNICLLASDESHSIAWNYSPISLATSAGTAR